MSRATCRSLEQVAGNPNNWLRLSYFAAQLPEGILLENHLISNNNDGTNSH